MDRGSRIAAALGELRIELLTQPNVRDVQFGFYDQGSWWGHGRPDAEQASDAQDADAIRVRVFLDEDTPDQLRDWKHLRPLDRLIREKVSEMDPEFFPYIDFLKRSELEVDA